MPAKLEPYNSKNYRIVRLRNGRGIAVCETLKSWWVLVLAVQLDLGGRTSNHSTKASNQTLKHCPSQLPVRTRLHSPHVPYFTPHLENAISSTYSSFSKSHLLYCFASTSTDMTDHTSHDAGAADTGAATVSLPFIHSTVSPCPVSVGISANA
jgi:hypothetical protein